jgi:hypothetical protein
MVVEDDLDGRIGRIGGVYEPEKLNEFASAVTGRIGRIGGVYELEKLNEFATAVTSRLLA